MCTLHIAVEKGKSLSKWKKLAKNVRKVFFAVASPLLWQMDKKVQNETH